METILKKRDKGVAGLTVLLSVVVFLFTIGFLVMIFALMGGELQSAVEKDVANNLTAQQVINDTYQELAGVTDWFGIIIVISAMVVLILLTVLIITAIRGSGMISGGGAAG